MKNHLAATCIAAALCLISSQAFAHAHLKQSSPAANATVTPAPPQLDLYFTEGLEPPFSSVKVTAADNTRVDDGALGLASGDNKHAIIHLKALSPGRYHVAWAATATDTHKTQGTFDFSVGSGTAKSDFVVANAWARPTIASMTTGAVYVSITNLGDTADTLVSADTPVARMAQPHETVRQGTSEVMKPLDKLPLAPGASVVFKPLDKHIMLMGLKAPLKTGSHFPLTLHFASGAAVTTDVTVSRDAPAAAAGGAHDDMKGMDMSGMKM